MVNLLSRWLAGHVSEEELLRAVEEDGRPELDDLRDGLRAGERRSQLQMQVREALEELALGGGADSRWDS
jgi:hypothetical protein